MSFSPNSNFNCSLMKSILLSVSLYLSLTSLKLSRAVRAAEKIASDSGDVSSS